MKRLGGAGGDRTNMYFVGRGLCILFAVGLLSGCSAPEITPSEQVIPEESEFTYSISISVPPIRISGGNLHWHKKLPNNTYTLEDVAIEIYNFGDFDILLAHLGVRVDENSRLFNIDMVLPSGEKTILVVEPVMTV